MTAKRVNTFRTLPGPNPYSREVQGKALETPAVVHLLRRATGLEVSPGEVVHRLASSAARIAVISGSLDHVAHLHDPETVLLMAAEIWRRGGVPFPFALPTVCDGTAQSTVGMCYSLLSRNQAADTVLTQMEAHAYHAAVVVQGCDKTPAAVLNALLMLDRIRRDRNEPPVAAVFVPVHVMRGGVLEPATRQHLLDIAGKAEAAGKTALGREILEALDSVLHCTTNQAFQGILERALSARVVRTGEKTRLENEIAAATGHPGGGMCGFNGTGNSTRFVMAALGLVHPAMELTCTAAKAPGVAAVMDDFCRIVGKPGMSVLRLFEQNFPNAVRIHSALGGSTNLVLHLVAAMKYAGYDFSLDDLFAVKGREAVPDIFRYSLQEGRDVFRFARERSRSDHQGMASVFKVLCDLGVPMNLDAPTVAGATWRRRIRGLGRPKSSVLVSTPSRAASGVDRFRGNFFSSAVVKVSGMTPRQVEQFDEKICGVVYFQNEDEANTALLAEAHVVKALAHGVRRDHLLALGGRGRRKDVLLQDLLERGALKIAFVIAGQGPCAFGFPEMFTPMQHINHNTLLREASLLLTDGRFSGVTVGPAFGHVTPEAVKGGGILYLRTGDFLFLDLGKRRLDLLDPGALAAGHCRRMGRGWMKSRMHLGNRRMNTMARRRSLIAPAARMGAVASAEHGIVPESVLQHATRTTTMMIG